MEQITVFTHALDLALRLVDTTSGQNVSGRAVEVRIDGCLTRFAVKGDGVLIFQNLGKRRFRLELSSPAFEPEAREVDLDAMGKEYPLLEIHLIPGEHYPGTTEFLTLRGVMPGIGGLSAVRAGDNACLIRAFDARKRLATLFNPHHLALDRVEYALVDPDREQYEPFRILRSVDDQTVKTDRILETPFQNYFPVSPLILGKTNPDGSYCLRVRDDARQARWIIRWEAGGEPRFRTVDFRQEPEAHLEEGGG